jgi:hypothetical protein
MARNDSEPMIIDEETDSWLSGRLFLFWGRRNYWAECRIPIVELQASGG